ncbi:atp12-domain-containing protein [Lichtheimia corymbifera JMRC:FSU:9682]|uniref:Atp12-domain-containing protein n=1 Tax=Lichtheimia corymbifera JMRC:FSU:9682 TaxID=1263082 RepID=A0A068RNH7_9FUNG|nr:atp12-domain-containing protein [Lichtheimia corymbifera JMRC:FSU:9682]
MSLRFANQWISRSTRLFSTTAISRLENVDPSKAEVAAKLAERTMKRFWKHAWVKEEADGCTVMLDKRNLRTPNGRHIVKFTSAQQPLAYLTAAEWEAQTESLKSHSLPLTSIIARAFDALDPTRAEDPRVRDQVIDKLMTYFDTDATCYHEDYPEMLTQLQEQHWKPLIAWASENYGVQINTTTGIFAVGQPPETREKLRAVVDQMGPLELAAFERAVMSSKSFLIGLALVKNALTVEQAAQAAHVEMNAQIDRWGEVEDSTS